MDHRAALLSVYTVQLYARKQLSAAEWEVAHEGSAHQNQGLFGFLSADFLSSASDCWTGSHWRQLQRYIDHRRRVSKHDKRSPAITM